MQDKPSILFVIPWRPSAPGAVNQAVIGLAREAARHGRLRPIILFNDWELDEHTVGDIDGIMTVSARLRAPLGDQQPARNLAGFALRMRGEINSWRGFIKKHNIQVINAHYTTPGALLFAVMRALRRARFRLVFSLHGNDVDEILAAGTALRATFRWMLKQADKIVCCSDSLAARARQAFKLGDRQLGTVYHGADAEELEHAAMHSYRPDTGGFDQYLINVARFGPHKGHEVLLDAYLQLVREGLKSAALVLVGQSTPHLASLRSRVRRSGLGEYVFFVPDLDHDRTLASIAKARLLIQASIEEPFGIPLLEAAFLRTPVVATSAGAIPEILGGYYPYLAKPGDVETLARCIDDALFNPTETERQVRLLKRRLPARFTWQNAYQHYEPIWLGGR